MEDVLKFDVKIDNFDTSDDVVYVLKPITADATKHQRNKLDYNFQREIKIPHSSIFNHKDSIIVKQTIDSLIIKKMNTSFFVEILKPGNFTNKYTLQKMKSNKYVSQATEEILFSAVKIDVYTWHRQTDNSSFWQHSEHERYYEFTIDDGDQSNDTYLTNSDIKQNTYEASYNGTKYLGPISINTSLKYSKTVSSESSPQEVPSLVLF